jgi:ribonuclease Z
MEITFLGTSSMVPTKDRNVQGIFLKYGNEGILIDCGEGTQRQMNIAGINRNDVTRILISHWHGDHISGLIGLIQTVGNAEHDAEKKLHLYGPKGSKEHLGHLMKSCIFEQKIHVEVKELEAKNLKVFLDTEEFTFSCASLKHSTPCLGFLFEEKEKRKMIPERLEHLGIRGPDVGKLQNGKDIVKNGKTIHPEDVSRIVKGKKIAFILDTGLCSNCYALADHADLLISEATYVSTLTDKAMAFKHLTAKDAAIIASKSNAERLILTHLSQRYKTNDEILNDAKDVFKETQVAFDFMKVKM